MSTCVRSPHRGVHELEHVPRLVLGGPWRVPAPAAIPREQHGEPEAGEHPPVVLDALTPSTLDLQLTEQRFHVQAVAEA